MRKSLFVIPVLFVALLVGFASLFIVDEREKALVLQFGQIRQVVEKPGIGFKLPFIQQVVKYDGRILSLDTETIEVTPSDDRRLVVDAFARYRISDVVRFRQAVGAGGIRIAEDRLSSILNAQIREVLGADQVTSDTILSPERRDLALRIRSQARASAEGLGIDIVDVRLKQTNLPQQNLDATFARMRAERAREAADEVARGNEAAQRVRAAADRTVVETVSNAEREAQITRGEADAERNRVYAEAFGDNPEFFSFYRSLSAFERSLKPENSTLVVSPSSEFAGPLFEAIRAEGLSEVSLDNVDLDKLRDLAPEAEISPELPVEERQRLLEDADALKSGLDELESEIDETEPQAAPEADGEGSDAGDPGAAAPAPAEPDAPDAGETSTEAPGVEAPEPDDTGQ
ncbi:protease modulator HflC [Pontibaca methylaminivorans]|uniref:HflC protein n=1 Tax=Pontibaca methylaminivorans TaxID=515897 RepID=A0A1R3WXK3_9RHOB|nr:protease modulator HflC [Pontibaca methylaminivorans]SIT82425.1 HflC protein [Pontibaca methylaminivorans]